MTHSRRWAATGVLLGALLTALASRAQATVPVVDLHVDLSYQVNFRAKSVELGSGQWKASELVEAGVVGVVLPLFVPYEVATNGPRLIDLETSYSRLYPQLHATVPYVVPGPMKLKGRVKTWFSIEDASAFADHPEEVARWVSNGTRLWGLVHSRDNALASSSGTGRVTATPSFGLTEKGQRLVRAIHAAGGIVDVSHASDRAFEDILVLAREARVPVVASHSNCRAVTNHPRNLTDAQLLAIAQTGGVIGINFHRTYLTNRRVASIDDVILHLRHLVRLVGPHQIAIGSDFEGGIVAPEGLRSASGFPRLAEALLRRGFTPSEVLEFFSRNALRILSYESPSGEPSR